MPHGELILLLALAMLCGVARAGYGTHVRLMMGEDDDEAVKLDPSTLSGDDVWPFLRRYAPLASEICAEARTKLTARRVLECQHIDDLLFIAQWRVENQDHTTGDVALEALARERWDMRVPGRFDARDWGQMNALMQRFALALLKPLGDPRCREGFIDIRTQLAVITELLNAYARLHALAYAGAVEIVEFVDRQADAEFTVDITVKEPTPPVYASVAALIKAMGGKFRPGARVYLVNHHSA